VLKKGSNCNAKQVLVLYENNEQEELAVLSLFFLLFAHRLVVLGGVVLVVLDVLSTPVSTYFLCGNRTKKKPSRPCPC
jgi:hypothetical protein